MGVQGLHRPLDAVIGVLTVVGGKDDGVVDDEAG